MIFHYPQRTVEPLNLKINNLDIELVDSFNFLGVMIDKNLSWREHIQRISLKISRTIGIMSRLKNVLPSDVLRVIYCSLILPYINYCILAWGFSLHISRIETLQKKSVRIIDKAFFLEHTDKIFKKYKLLKIDDIIKLKCLVFFYRFKNNSSPTPLNGIPSVSINFSRNLRSRENRILNNYFSSSYAGQKCFRHYLPIIINECDNTLIQAIRTKTLIAFKRLCRQRFLDNYSNEECQISDCYACRLKLNFGT